MYVVVCMILVNCMNSLSYTIAVLGLPSLSLRRMLGIQLVDNLRKLLCRCGAVHLVPAYQLE